VGVGERERGRETHRWQGRRHVAGSRACELRAGMRGPATPQLSHPHSDQQLRLPQMPPNLPC
jgi:hypothetical protein